MLSRTSQSESGESCLLESLRMGWFKGTKNPQQLVARWLGFLGFAAVAWVQFLVRELRAHKQHGKAKKEKQVFSPVYPQFEVPVTHTLLVSFFCFWPWSKVWGILVPDQQWNPYFLHCKQEVLTTVPPGKLPQRILGTICLFSCLSVVSDSLRPLGLQHARPPCPSPTPRVYSNSCPLSWWCHPTISSLSSPSPPTFNLSQHQGLFFSFFYVSADFFFFNF